MTNDLLVRGGVLAGRIVDLRVRSGLIAEIGPLLRRHGEDVLEASGSVLIPGLHDHHLHLHGLAAELDSVRCGPPEVGTIDELASALRDAAASGQPVRGTGYHESVGGALNRDLLDGLVAAVPVRIQHRSGAAWFLNSAALAAAGLAAVRDPAVERDAQDQPTGRLWRGDHLLRTVATPLPDLTRVGRLLSRLGVTGVTDATPSLAPRALQALREAHLSASLPQRLLLLGAPMGDGGSDVGPWKMVLNEAAGLDLHRVTEVINACHGARRAVALHAVTAAEAVVAMTAVRTAGSFPGDRLEHASVLPRELDGDLRDLGITVVTQPHFVAERGDSYLADVEPRDRPLLYRCRSLLDAGIAVGAGTDAPYGHHDPWRSVTAAVTRRTATGAVLEAAERLEAARALNLYLSEAGAPGGAPRRIKPGAVADLCLLDAPLAVVVREPDSHWVRATVVAGQVVFDGHADG